MPLSSGFPANPGKSGIKINYSLNGVGKKQISDKKIGVEIYNATTKKKVKKIVTSKNGIVTLGAVNGHIKNKKTNKLKIRTYIKGDKKVTYSKYSNVKSIKY